jgi:hypothetical protein
MLQRVFHLLLKADHRLQVVGPFSRPIINRTGERWDTMFQPPLVIQSLLEPFGERLFGFFGGQRALEGSFQPFEGV